MNKLPITKQKQILQLLVEGNSLRSCTRIADVSINTVTRLLENVGRACIKFHDEHVLNIKAQRLQCDEVWSFVYHKEKQNIEDRTDTGNIWTWIGMDADSKLVVSWYVGKRNLDSAYFFMKDVSSRLSTKVQLTTDGYKAYIKAVHKAFDVPVDYGQLVKLYGDERSRDNEGKEQHGKYVGAEKETIFGEPNHKFTSTSFIERQNLTMRMQMRRFTRKTNGFSKKLENHIYSIAIHFVYYNFVRQHKTLSITPAMQAGLTKRFMSIEDILKMAA